MKKALQLLAAIIYTSTLCAQMPTDPFAGIMRSTTESEIGLVCAPFYGSSDDSVLVRLFDQNRGTGNLYMPANTYNTPRYATNGKDVAAIALDWDADQFDDMMYAFRGTLASLPVIYISKVNFRRSNLLIDSVSLISIPSVNMGQVNSSIALAKGNFDSQPGDELLLAWKEIVSNVHTIKLQVFKITANGITPQQTLSFNTKAQNNSIKSVDITVGDFDGNGRPEAALAYVDTLGGTNATAVVNYIEITEQGGTFTLTSKARAKVTNATSNFFNFSVSSGRLNPKDTAADRVLFALEYYDNNQQPDPAYMEVLGIVKLNQQGIPAVTSNAASPRVLSVNDALEIGTATGQLDATGAVEGIVATGGSATVLSVDSNDAITRRGSGSYAIGSDISRLPSRFVYVSDVNRDFRNDILIAGYAENNQNDYYVKFTGFSIGNNGLNDPLQAYESSAPTADLSPAYNNVPRYAIAVGDFNGGNLTIGEPKYFAKTDITPTVILNAPPTHFDKLNDHAYDVCQCRFWDTGTNDECQYFYTEYSTSQSNSTTVETTFNSDWGISSRLEVEASFIGVDVTAYVGGHYGEKFSQVQSYNETKTITATYRTRYDDYLYGAINKIHYFEYPIDSNGINVGHMLVALRDTVSVFTYTPTLGYLAEDFIPEHEPENLLSYREYNNFAAENPEVRELMYAGVVTPFTQGQVNTSQPGAIISYDRTTVNNLSTSNTKEYGLEAGSSVEVMGVKASVDGTYNSSTMSTQTVTSTNNVKIDLSLTVGLRDQLQDYSIQPFLFWSNRGAFTIDYDVNLDNQNANFWTTNYGNKPDFSMLLPWLLDTVKDPSTLVTDPEFYRKSKSIFYSRNDFGAGDTITVYGYIYNKSLFNYTGNVQYRFYLGAPESGTLLSDVSGTSTFSVDTLPRRGRKLVSFKWVVPAGFSHATSKVYLSIDPNNLVDEIHEDNNIGYKGFGNSTPVGVKPVAKVEEKAMAIFPNPADRYSQAEFSMAEAGVAELYLLDINGTTIRKLTKETLAPGNYIVPFNTHDLPAGVYIVNGQINNTAVSKKVIVAHN